jgi:DNA polymerase III subunit epsilon
VEAEMADGVIQRRIAETPIAVIDFETTGLTPGADRVIEVSVVRVDPGEAPRLAFDTLVNPQRRVAATEIHGITDADVRDAPQFRDVAGELVEHLQGCVVASFNVYFDMPFLTFELGEVGARHVPPHFCLMYLRPMLDLGPRCRLEQACRDHGIGFDATHVAADDALAAAKLYALYRATLDRRGVATFADLARLRSYKFNRSFGNRPFADAAGHGLQRHGRVRSRSGHAAPAADPARAALKAYWGALNSALADLEVTDEEVAAMRAERERGGLREEQVRVLHARAFASVLNQFTADGAIDDREARTLHRLQECLAKLGWAPGR